MKPRRQAESEWLSVVRAISDEQLTLLPSDSGMPSVHASDRDLRHHFDVMWGHTRYVRAAIEDAVVVDAGCGAGDLSLLLAILGARRVISLDFQPKCVEFTRLLVNGIGGFANVEVHQADVAEFSIPPSTVDGVFSIEAISHYRRAEEFLVNAAAWLRPGGFMFVSDGNNAASSSIRRITHEVWAAFESNPAPLTVHGHSKGPGCYRDRRRELIESSFPDLTVVEVETLTEATFGMSTEEIQRSIPEFRESPLGSPSADRCDCPKDPDTDCMMERLFEPRELARGMRESGMRCRVVSVGPARRDLGLVRLLWELASPLTIYAPRGFALVCRRTDT